MVVYIYGMDWLESPPNSYTEVLGPRTSECLCLETELLERGSQVKLGSSRWALAQHGGGSGSAAQLCLSLCDPMDCSPPGSSVHWIFQARILECVVIPTPGDLPKPGIKTVSPALTGGFFNTAPLGSNVYYFPILKAKQVGSVTRRRSGRPEGWPFILPGWKYSQGRIPGGEDP